MKESSMERRNTDIENAQSVKRKYQEALMGKANVVGVGIGFRQRGGKRTSEVVLVVMVDEKIAADALSEKDLVPVELDGVPVDVQEVGRIRAERRPKEESRIE
jgi:hypothetical protein